MLSNIVTSFCMAALVTEDTEIPAAEQPRSDPVRRQLQPQIACRAALEAWKDSEKKET